MHLNACMWFGDDDDPRFKFPVANQAAYDTLVDGVAATGFFRMGNVVIPSTAFTMLDLVPGP